jgi:hypothetical protein
VSQQVWHNKDPSPLPKDRESRAYRLYLAPRNRNLRIFRGFFFLLFELWREKKKMGWNFFDRVGPPPLKIPGSAPHKLDKNHITSQNMGDSFYHIFTTKIPILYTLFFGLRGVGIHNVI